MSQSNVIFATLFVAFVVFITMRGKLPAYLSALVGTNAPGGSDKAAPAASGNPGSNLIGGIVSSFLGR